MVENPNIVILYEVYEDQAAPDAPRASKHFQEIVIGKILPLLTKRTAKQLKLLGY